jgi:glucose-6-phosphate dehydrogenase assembly protein OpcA
MAKGDVFVTRPEIGPPERLRPRATPIHGAVWQASVLDAGAVQDELNRLWAGAKTVLGPTAAEEKIVAEGEAMPAAAISRANTLNLIAVARSTAEADRIEHAVGYLGDFYPARAIVLIADPTRSGRGDDGLDVRVSLLEQTSLDRPTTRFECVTVAAGATATSRFASLVSSLLVPELPDFLWWPGDSLSTALFQDLTDIADRLVIDSAVLVDPAGGLRVLAAQTMRAHQFPRVTDFAWLRLTSWRSLVAQFFDLPAARPCLDNINLVELTCSEAPSGVSGLTAALLTAGWLGSRLGWRPATLLERSPSLWRTEMVSAAGDTVVLRLRAGGGTADGPGLGSIELTSRGQEQGSFRVQRITSTALTTSSQTTTMPRVGRMVYAEELEEADLLGRALHTFGSDPIYEEALRFAAELAPGAFLARDGASADRSHATREADSHD